MLAALTADLLILRPTAMWLNQLVRRFKKALTRRVRRSAPVRAIEIETSEISLPGERIDTFIEFPLERIDSAG